MPRKNSLTDEDGRSLTPDLELPEPNAFTPDLDAPVRRSTTRSPTDPAASHKTPRDRFRAAVRKVMQLHRTSAVFSNYIGIGAEPGIDPRKDFASFNYGHIRQKCEIEVVDYSSIRSSARGMSNAEFVDMMTKGTYERPLWSKVRWINIGGVSWDVMSALAIKYELHPLALEDVLSNRDLARSRADYYLAHLSLRVLCHTVVSDEEVTDSPDMNITDHARASSPEPMDQEHNDVGQSERIAEMAVWDGSALQSNFSTRKNKLGRKGKWVGDVEHAASAAQSYISKKFSRRLTGPVRRAHWDEGKAIGALKEGERVHVKICPIHIFLRRDGTVITVHSAPNLRFTAPIAERLRQQDTVLRATADPSLLVHSLLDLIADKALQVVDAYQGKILKLEKDILLKPKMSTVRNLHVISGDLVLHKRTLGPIKTLVYGLRRYDLDRCAALIDTGAPIKTKVEGYMSRKAIIYLADIMDHMEHVLTSLDMFEAIAENLINFTFNMVSADMGEVMRRLTMATIIFLPLTLLTGYFGMNFQRMWSIRDNGHSDIIYWEIALPLLAIVIPAFIYNDIIRMVHYLKKKTFARNTLNGSI